MKIQINFKISKMIHKIKKKKMKINQMIKMKKIKIRMIKMK